MNVKLYPEFYNDVFGPISNPGSSSHMSGPCRAGYLAHTLLGEDVKSIDIKIDKSGSFGEGLGQMNEDIGMLNGAYGKLPDAENFFEIKDILNSKNISFSFEFGSLTESDHPNAMKFHLTGRSGKKITLVVNSTGGGMVETVAVNGIRFSGKGDSWVILIFDTDPEDNKYAQKIKDIVKREYEVLTSGDSFERAEGAENPAGFKRLLWFCLEERPDIELIRKESPKKEVFLMEPVLPVITSARKKPQRYSTFKEWRELAAKEGKSLYETAVEYEMDASGWSREKVEDHMKSIILKALKRRISALYEDESLLMKNPYRIIYHREWENATRKSLLVNGITQKAIRYMLSAQASMNGVLDIPGPMSNGAGYLFSVLTAVKEEYGLDDEALIRGLFVAASVGAIAYTQTEPTGEIIGCAGECGVCAAMTAAAIVEMLGGTPEEIENAASFTLQSAIGWPCDPIPGGQGTPCTSRTLFIVSMPQVYAQWALMGAICVVPFDEVLDTVDKVGRSLSSDLLCTLRGGLCATCSGRECAKAFREDRKRAKN